MRTNVWIYNALAFIVVSLVDAGRGKKSPKYELQRYEKTESHMLACPGCPQVPRVQSSRSQEHCARKCKKGKTHFNCRAFNFEKHTGKCHLLAFDRLTQGTQTQASVNFTLYESKGFSVDTINPTTQHPMLLNSSSGETYTSYIRECIVGTKDNYRGRRSRTKSNIACQAWSDNNINDHTYCSVTESGCFKCERVGIGLVKRSCKRFYPHKYPRQDLRENFCRNPNNDPGGPWCYTTDPNVRSEDCGLQQCSQQVCMTCNGEDYEGKMDHTESGKECQRWDASRPHKHPFKPNKYRDKYFKDNYCRNPDNRLRPWCYTLDAKVPWEYCNISMCDSSVDIDSNVNVTTTCVQGKGTDYRGTMNITPEGVSCQRWDSQFPHNHYFHPHNYKCKDLQENYCRNPDGSDYPWCFTTDPNQRKANCTHIPKCDAEVPQITECYEDIGENYRGTLSMTRSGIPCGDWSNHINSGDSHSAVSDVGLDKNYCRNPDRDKHGPWCYTNANSRLSWDYCKLKRCESGESPTQTPQPKTVLSPKISCFVHINTRIVGGHQVHGADGSWVVSIQRENDHLCGGSLIREDWILTDQQCFTSCVPDLSDYSVQVGLRHLNQSSIHPRLRIARLICGPEGSNLVLLKLVRPAPVSEGASDIHLPVKECTIAEGTNCTMYGWGETKNTGYDEALKAVTLPMVNNDMCTRLKAGAGESRVCAGGRKGEGMCEKDNGGPLVCQEQERKVIIGVSIQRTKCASSQPALFVNVAFYSGWIYKVFKCYPS